MRMTKVETILQIDPDLNYGFKSINKTNTFRALLEGVQPSKVYIRTGQCRSTCQNHFKALRSRMGLRCVNECIAVIRSRYDKDLLPSGVLIKYDLKRLEDLPIKEAIKVIISNKLTTNKGNLTLTAKQLGVNRNYIYNRVDSVEITKYRDSI